MTPQQTLAAQDVDSADAHQARAVRVADLQAKLTARDGKPGFKLNCGALRAEIARLESYLGGSNGQ